MVIPPAPTASLDKPSCYASGGMGLFLLFLWQRGVVPFVVPEARGMVRSVLARHSQGGFGSKISVLACCWRIGFGSVDVSPSLAESFRIGRFRPVVGGVVLINCFPGKW